MSDLLILFQTTNSFPQSNDYKLSFSSENPIRFAEINCENCLTSQYLNSGQVITLKSAQLYCIELKHVNCELSHDIILTSQEPTRINLSFNIKPYSKYDQCLLEEMTSPDYYTYYVWTHSTQCNLDFLQQTFNLKPIERNRPNKDLFIFGHRGMGSEDCKYIQSKDHTFENSLGAFQKAYIMRLPAVELDILLSRDNQFIIHHNFTFKIDSHEDGNSALDVKSIDPVLTKETPNLANKLSFEEIRQKLNYFTDHVDDNDRVPRIQDVFSRIPKELGLDIEIKYPKFTPVDMYREFSYDSKAMFDSLPCVFFGNINFVIDRIGTELIENKSNNEGRPILFSCFNADLCYSLKKKYPTLQVLFISLIGRKNGNSFDTRHQTWQGAVAWTKFANLDGLVIPYESLSLYSDEELDRFTDKLIEYEKPCYVFGSECCLKEAQEKICRLGMSGLFLDDVEHYMQDDWKVNRL